MASELVRELLDAGIHFGHRVSRWNPKMRPYIFGKRNMIHVIDIKETLKGLFKAKKFLTTVVAEGGDVVFVATKRQAKNSVEAQAKRCQMHYVTERWLGGTLTNFQTVRARLARLEELERLEETGELGNYSKKMISTLQREKKKIKRNLEGLRKMNSFPSVMVAFDVGHEHIAVREAKKLGIPTVCLIDTNADPDYADIPIPGNDDSMRAAEIIARELADSVLTGLEARPEEAPAGEETAPSESMPKPGRPRPRRRPPQRTQPSEAPAESPAAEAASAEPSGTESPASEPPAAETAASDSSAPMADSGQEESPSAAPAEEKQ